MGEGAFLPSRARQLALALAAGVTLAALGLLAPPTARAQVTTPPLANGPLFNYNLPGNLALLISNEYPTAENDANWGNYSDKTNYAGYFDPNKCYVYQFNGQQPGQSYFRPVTHAGGPNGHFCDIASLTSTGVARNNFPNTLSSGLWSGNFMNWAATQTIDAVRGTMTGGYRVVDRASTADLMPDQKTRGVGTPLTVLEKAWSSRHYYGKPSSQMRGTRLMRSWYSDYAVQYTFPPELVGNLTPFGKWPDGKWWRTRRGDPGVIPGGFFTFVKGLGNRMMFSPVDSTLWYPTDLPTLWDGSTGAADATLTAMNVGADNTKKDKKTGVATDSVSNDDLKPSRMTYDDKSATDYGGDSGRSKQCSLDNNPYPCFQVYVRVSVCENGTGLDGKSLLEANCVRYNSPSEHYKPEGLLQKYANQMRYSVFSYPRNGHRNTALLRAPMRFIGPTEPNLDPTVDPTPNPTGEWDPGTGVMSINPDVAMGLSIPNAYPADSLGTGKEAGKEVGKGGSIVNGGPVPLVNYKANKPKSWVSKTPVINLYYPMDPQGQSGAMNYLNKYGQYYGYMKDRSWKDFDTVDDLYYAALRYYRNQSNPWGTSNTSFAYAMPPGDDTLSTAATDAFPFVKDWKDPILYRCQKNFILGVSDTHTWNGRTTGPNYKDIPNLDGGVGGANAVDTWVNRVGDMEGIRNRWPADAGPAPSMDWPSWDNNGTMNTPNSTYYTAGMAYFMHTSDIRPDLMTLGKLNDKVTVDTYWVDVTEFNAIEHLNPYLLAAKYGGFSVPTNYDVNRSTDLDPSWWTTPGNTMRTHLRNDPTSYKGGSPDGDSATFNDSASDGSDKPDTTTDEDSGGADDGTLGCGGNSLLSCWQTISKGRYPKPDNYFTAADSAKMAAGLQKAFADMTSALKAYSMAFALSTSAVKEEGSPSYAAQFSAANWTGTVTGNRLRVTPGVDGAEDTVSQEQAWSTDEVLGQQFLTRAATQEDDGTGRDILIDVPAYNGASSNRRVVTWDGSKGTRFYWKPDGPGAPAGVYGLTAAQKNALYPLSYGGKTVTLPGGGADYVNYLRGDSTHEIGSELPGSASALRARDLKLGDVINSKLMVVNPPQMLYSDNYNPGYSAFKNLLGSGQTDPSDPSKVDTSKIRPPMIYFGANDGMMHALTASLNDGDASQSSDEGGYEVFAYIPSLLFQTLPVGSPGGTDTSPNNPLTWLGNPNYVHHYSVDATPQAFDVDFDRAGSASSISGASDAAKSTPDWRTILVGGLGKGGKGFYAIDITDPTTIYRGLVNPSAGTVEQAAADRVLWEFSAPDMGYSYGQPIAVKTAKYGWVVALTSGYANADGKGHLYLLNPKTGALLQKIDTASSSVGLTQATAYVADYADYTSSAIYAGDLNGQLWRFDLSSADAIPDSATLLAKLTAADGSAQPITSAPLVEIHPSNNKRYVLVGTGRLLDQSDVSSTQKQTFYAIVDGNALTFNAVGAPITRDSLIQIQDLTVANDISPDAKGWYHDLAGDNMNFVKPGESTTSSTSATGERVVTAAVAYNGMVAFSSQLMTPDPCLPSVGNLYMLNFANGQTGLPDNAAYLGLKTPVTDMFFADTPGGIRLMVGDTLGNVRSIKTPSSAGGAIKMLNWRNVPLGGN